MTEPNNWSHATYYFLASLTSFAAYFRAKLEQATLQPKTKTTTSLIPYNTTRPNSKGLAHLFQLLSTRRTSGVQIFSLVELEVEAQAEQIEIQVVKRLSRTIPPEPSRSVHPPLLRSPSASPT
ncbi:hypothetical protein PM082_001831 [Marasmius tenuissimus]|nr:hypothetical protein PM082_001831 [Marasmius tenuissimus]